MNDDPECTSNWYGSVLSDLAKAMRRDGLIKTAELLDDAASQLLIEEAQLLRERQASAAQTIRLIGK